jgi:hypothetical protein
MMEGPAPGKPFSVGEAVTLSGRVAWADRNEVLVDLDGAPPVRTEAGDFLQRAAVAVGVGFVRRKE